MREAPERLVFIDETAVKTNLTRLRGRAPRGERLPGAAPFGAWGPLHDAPRHSLRASPLTASSRLGSSTAP